MRAWVAMIATVGAAVGFSGAADAVPFEEFRFNGEVVGDPYPESSIGFDRKRARNRRPRIVNFTASGLNYTCADGSSGETSQLKLVGGFTIRRDRTFGRRADAVISGFDPPAKLVGKVRRHGRVTGRIRVHGELDPSGNPGLQCRTGPLEWKARRRPREPSLP